MNSIKSSNESITDEMALLAQTPTPQRAAAAGISDSLPQMQQRNEIRGEIHDARR
jgi:hypothetical protein